MYKQLTTKVLYTLYTGQSFYDAKLTVRPPKLLGSQPNVGVYRDILSAWVACCHIYMYVSDVHVQYRGHKVDSTPQDNAETKLILPL